MEEFALLGIEKNVFRRERFQFDHKLHTSFRPSQCTLTATVKRTASGAAGFATGSVTFSVATTVIGTANLNGSGVATLSAGTSGIAADQYPVTAKYNGDASDVASSSSAVTVTVQ
jgi:hypothetical protein